MHSVNSPTGASSEERCERNGKASTAALANEAASRLAVERKLFCWVHLATTQLVRKAATRDAKLQHFCKRNDMMNDNTAQGATTVVPIEEWSHLRIGAKKRPDSAVLPAAWFQMNASQALDAVIGVLGLAVAIHDKNASNL
ncbi:hypothetical protein Esti_003045 [Eimeria stiedai]